MPSKSGKGPTGPRTPAGKAKASQNAVKHGVFAHRLSLEDDQKMRHLTKQIRREFRLDGALEFEIGRELARNRLEKSRIDEYTDQEFKKAEILGHLDLKEYESAAPLLRRSVMSSQGQENCRARMAPALFVTFLLKLKERIEKDGPQPEKDLELLRTLYADQVTELGDVIFLQYKTMMASGQRQSEQNAVTLKNHYAGYQEGLIDSIQSEIEVQQILARDDEVKTCLSLIPGLRLLPAESIVDRLQKLRTANAREFGRLLGSLETLRRLKG